MSQLIKYEVHDRGEPSPIVYLMPPEGMVFIRGKSLMEIMPENAQHALEWLTEACRVLQTCLVNGDNCDLSDDLLLFGLLTADEVAHLLAEMVARGEVGEELQRQLVASTAELN
jgi:hypothetical protein